MKLLDLIGLRQSVRLYTDKEVEQEKIDRCLEAARLAPSACNSQPWTFIVVNEPELREKVAKETWSSVIRFNKFVDNAPVIVVIVLEKSKAITQVGQKIKDREWRQMDVGIAAEHFCLQATEEGLGTCMLGWFNQKPIKKLLNIPKNKFIALCISVGYAPEGYYQRKKIRKGMEEMVRYNRY